MYHIQRPRSNACTRNARQDSPSKNKLGIALPIPYRQLRQKYKEFAAHA
jgi:hypothetical protein